MKVKEYMDTLHKDIITLRNSENADVTCETVRRIINLENHYEHVFPIAKQPLAEAQHRENYSHYNEKSIYLHQKANKSRATAGRIVIFNLALQLAFLYVFKALPFIIIITALCLYVAALCYVISATIRKRHCARECDEWIFKHWYTEREIWTYADYNQP